MLAERHPPLGVARATAQSSHGVWDRAGWQEGQATGPGWLSVRGEFSCTALPSVVGTVRSTGVTGAAGSIGSLRTVVVDASTRLRGVVLLLHLVDLGLEHPGGAAEAARGVRKLLPAEDDDDQHRDDDDLGGSESCPWGPSPVMSSARPDLALRGLASVYARPRRKPVGSALRGGPPSSRPAVPILRPHPVSWLDGGDRAAGSTSRSSSARASSSATSRARPLHLARQHRGAAPHLAAPASRGKPPTRPAPRPRAAPTPTTAARRQPLTSDAG